MNMKKQIYEYKRLESDNHIRVLILEPSQDPSAPLQCSIKQHELGTAAEQYECISYTWGSPTLSAHILCDDGSAIEITANLHSALTRFRSNSNPRCFWADAVCINQVNSEEKSRQIPLMPQIYRNASCVLVWLGSGVDGESETMQYLARFGNLPVHFSKQDQEVAQGREPQSSEAQESIRRFFHLPWFGRRWVVQEVVLNPDVMFYCGMSEISWPRLHLTIESLPVGIWNDTTGSQIRKSLQKLGDLWRTWSYLDRKTMNCELFELLDSFHHFQCKEDKDRIYAVAGLASDVQTSTELMPLKPSQEKMHLVPDYSLSDDELFRQIALQRMESGRVFTTLAYAGALGPRNGPRALSSWAPDFRLSKLWCTIWKDPDPEYRPTVEIRSDGSLMLKAEVDTPYRTLYGNSWNSCVVQNIFPASTDPEPRSILQFLRGCLHWIHSIPTIAGEKIYWLKIGLCKVLFTVATKLSKEEYEMKGLTSDLILHIVSVLNSSNVKKTIGGDKTVTWLLKSLFDDEDSENKDLKELTPYLSMIFIGLKGRCFFLSNTITVSQRWGSDDRGGWNTYGICRLGIGPGDTVAGDIIVKFTGVEQSLFFRKGKDGRHQVLGDGYFTVLPQFLKNEFRSFTEEILIA